ncbi:hypothetical protein PV328_001308 [Microctonus aethiopoides]|uniref:Mutator-like transposase domain-containing protein n=1 Tax=Microctonus aethiopoides TaxID=144406 RepID=A0AA39FWN1_9HYME|nr:hypothetical protein PV328_001308 [Microctonus aethiopoides]
MPRKCSRIRRATEKVHLSRTKKRKNVFNPKTVETDKSSFDPSAKKFKMQKEILVPRDSSVEYRILNFITVFAALSNYVKCKSCDGEVKFETASPRGLGFKIIILCDKCEDRAINSSPFVKHSYEINRRFIFVMRVLGIGLKGAAKFCGLMDMPVFLTQKIYDLIIDNIYSCVKVATEKLFEKACAEEKDATSENQVDERSEELTVASDGTWKKRGFSSLHGVTSLIGYYTGKIIDIVVKSSYCKQCEPWKNKNNTEEYSKWYDDHKDICSANYNGSSGKMDVDSVIEMFRRSMEKYNVRYRNYIGDGDSETYSGILKAASDGEVEVVKLLERCVGNSTQNINERYNQLIWKMTPKIIPCGSKVVEVVAHIAAGMFNEGAISLLYFMNAMGISIGPAAHTYVEKADADRIMISNSRTHGNTHEGRMARRQSQLDLLEAADVD